MPTIHIIGSLKILMYFDDHNPPHFHVEYNEYETLIGIDDLKILEGGMPEKQLQKAIKWASKNKETLMNFWNKFNNN